jgi:probable H4MPT-linked C1 transfer pathway protein
MTWLGLDIGGANLKAADGLGWARSVPFPLWREPERLLAALTELIASAPVANRLAVTMTGELCDCFRTKAEGVGHILTAVQQAAETRHVRVYLVDGRLVSICEARSLPQLAAASNWHVLARFAGRYVDRAAALLMDIGSTTTDIVPLVEGQPRPQGFNDTDRLLAGELVYTGVGRTPVCAVTRWLPWRGQQCPLAAEVFATTADAYVILGDIEEQSDCTSTADGRPLTREFSRERLALMICADATVFDDHDARLAAERIREAQMAQLNRAVQQVTGTMNCEPESIVISGTGVFLAESLCRQTLPAARIESLAKQVSREASQSAPAHALAALAREMA